MSIIANDEMRMIKPKGTNITILTASRKRWIELAGSKQFNPALTVRRLKSRKDTYRVWAGKNFCGQLFV